MTFKIGMKVVCVDDTQPDQKDLAPWYFYVHNGIRRGDVYTVAATGLVHDADPRRLPAIALSEFSDRVFWAHRFRPAVSPKQQVSFTTGAPSDSRKWDNRRKRVEVVS